MSDTPETNVWTKHRKNSKEKEKSPAKPHPLTDLNTSGGARSNIFAALAECAEEMVDLDISKKNEDGSKPGKTLNYIDDHCNPVFRELAVINGKINRMTVKQLRDRLKSFSLDHSGSKDVQKNRLKAYYKKQKLEEAQKFDPKIELLHQFDYYIIIDFEATCEVGNSARYKHEIIEFPAMLVDTKKREIVAEFQSYCKPVLNPTLSGFCTYLTGITQMEVNVSPTFPEVLQKFEKWMEAHKLFDTPDKFAVVTDGPWDMGRFMFLQCKISEIPFPKWCREWINIRKTYSNFYNTRRICLKDMLYNLQMKFQGRPHSGRDDSYNIARIALRLLKDGSEMRLNEEISSNALKSDRYLPWEDNVVRSVSKKMLRTRKIAKMKKENCSLSDTKNNQDDTSKTNDSDKNADERKTLHKASEDKIPVVAEPVYVIDYKNRIEFPELGSKRVKA